MDFFISSCFVHLRKPDSDIFRLALDIAQAAPEQIVYVDDQPMFVEIAEGLGIHSIYHTDFQSTRAKVASFGLQLNEELGADGLAGCDSSRRDSCTPRGRK